MCIVRCSGRLGGVSSREGGVHPLVDRIFDTRLLKHYLSATTVADGKNTRKYVPKDTQRGSCKFDMMREFSRFWSAVTISQT